MRGLSEGATPHHISFESFGIRMEARASSEEILARMEPLLPPPARRTDDVPDAKTFAIVDEGSARYSVWNPTVMVCAHVGLELALITLEGQMRSWVAVHSP